MYIKEFSINNFRSYRNFTIKADSNTNILTGVNNSGKTTILEAIALWNEIFYFLIGKAGRADSRIGISKGQFRFGKKGQNYIDYRNINSVRSFSYKDIFYNSDSSSPIQLSAKLFIEDGIEITIGFEMIEANGNNYNVYLIDHDNFNFTQFNQIFSNLPECIGCYFSTPVATIASSEEFALTPKIKEGIKVRESFQYFRNRLFNLHSGDQFDDFKEKLSNILYNESGCIDFQITGDKTKDILITVEINIKNKGYRNVSLLGSGTIQVIEILLHLYENRRDINIILLDEPDSHIHRDIQKRLLNYLKTISIQVFLTTHNESLIRSANPKHIFFIDETVSDDSDSIIEPIGNVTLPQRRFGVESSYHSKIISQIGNETSLDILNALEADKIIFVEGADDSDYIQRILQKNNIDKEIVFWSFGGFDKLLSKIGNYKEFFSSLGASHPLWEKCCIIADADYMTDIQKNNLKNILNTKLNIPIFIWDAYTIEATIFSDINKLENLLSAECTKQNIIKSSVEISSFITDNFQSINTNKRDLINNNPDICNRITGQLEGRINNLYNHLEISRIRVFENITIPNLFNHYRLYCDQQLQSGRIAHICNKDDVESVLENIFNDLGLIKNEGIENYFSQLLDNLNYTSMNNEWLNLVQFINS